MNKLQRIGLIPAASSSAAQLWRSIEPSPNLLKSLKSFYWDYFLYFLFSLIFGKSFTSKILMFSVEESLLIERSKMMDWGGLSLVTIIGGYFIDLLPICFNLYSLIFLIKSLAPPATYPEFWLKPWAVIETATIPPFGLNYPSIWFIWSDASSLKLGWHFIFFGLAGSICISLP